MIVPRLIGGLGNQMFQAAAAYALSRRAGAVMAINYDNGWYCITPLGQPSKYRDTVYSKIPTTGAIPEAEWNEPHYHYAEMPVPSGDLSTVGYYQSPKYFQDYKDDIKKLFCFDSAHDCSHLVGDDTTGVHIRRADYTTLTDVHGILGLDYYKRAIDKAGGENVVICSDDPDWAYDNFGSDCQISNFESEVDDMYLLSQCKRVIISNSSFSWWGAYLGKEKEQVIAPDKWFGPGGPDNFSDVYVDSWDRIPI